MSIILIVLLIVFILLIVMFLPIGFSMVIAAIAALLVKGTMPFQMVPQKIFVAVDSFTLLAVPFFILCGDLMIVGGISKRLIDLANNLIGWVKGGLAYVTILASAFFGAISGSALATTSAIGGLMYPEMLKARYKPPFAAAIGALGGTLGIIIPPSIAFIIFGTQTGTSVVKLFMGGAAAGIYITALYMLAARTELAVSRADTIQAKRPSIKELLLSFKNAFWGLLAPLIILGGIYSGQFTATEAAVIAVVYSIIIGFFIYKELNFKNLVECVINSAVATGTILFLVGVASLFSWILTFEGVATMLNNLIITIGVNKLMFLLIINIIYLILGMLMETVPIIILTVPIFYPLAMTLGVDPVHFGVITVVNLAFGLITPPFGTCLFMANSYSKQPVLTMVGQLRMFYLFGVIGILFVTYAPGAILWIIN